MPHQEQQQRQQQQSETFTQLSGAGPATPGMEEEDPAAAMSEPGMHAQAVDGSNPIPKLTPVPESSQEGYGDASQHSKVPSFPTCTQRHSCYGPT
jgi:hypothetical protein